MFTEAFENGRRRAEQEVQTKFQAHNSRIDPGSVQRLAVKAIAAGQSPTKRQINNPGRGNHGDWEILLGGQVVMWMHPNKVDKFLEQVNTRIRRIKEGKGPKGPGW